VIEGLSDLAGKVPGWVLLGVVFFLGGGAGAAIQALRDVALRAIELSHEDEEEPPRVLRPIEVLRDSDLMWHTLERLREEVSADRVFLSRQENGGKLPSVGRDLTSSIDLEAVGDAVRSMKMEWQHQILDAPLTHLLVKMYQKGGVQVLPDEAEGIMRGNIQAAGSPVVHMFPVFSTEGTFYYLSIHLKEQDAPALDDALYRDRIRVAVAALVNVFDRWYEGTPPK